MSRASRGSLFRYALGAMRHADVHPHLNPPPRGGGVYLLAEQYLGLIFSAGPGLI